MPDEQTASGWILLIYRVPSEPSSSRVSVWRDLKRTGALYLQQCVCIVPRRDDLRAQVVAARHNADTLLQIQRAGPLEVPPHRDATTRRLGRNAVNEEDPA